MLQTQGHVSPFRKYRTVTRLSSHGCIDRGVARRLKRYFKDWRLRGLFSFQDLYVGLSPSSAPGVFSLLAGTELTDGVYYPLGGFGKVSRLSWSTAGFVSIEPFLSGFGHVGRTEYVKEYLFCLKFRGSRFPRTGHVC